ncbi:4340_t:CDS:1 [Entrophospora sp. SA101]|nr:3966_t:CDS:1 [Entrophospora sp. SA101]CAJ0762671.1 4340_t:CDS:1 [Entrophospora sp. SA101]CAJ0829884.1 2925_t:CDS:1 [Entrophospora sp. SA101]CAJ0847758.1 1587_t:CDS:1 [Entrophospora sp. SA101]CAJ0895642.1 12825_t:CDS:1 [Entrophospora sp. SA101]
MSGHKPDPKQDKKSPSITGGDGSIVSKIQDVIRPADDKGGPSIAGLKSEDVGKTLDSPVMEPVVKVIERAITKIDPDTKEERARETEYISARIAHLDILITVGLYYTSLLMSWFTQLGNSYSVQDFFTNLFLESFDISDWNFGSLDLVGKISGATASLQTVMLGMVGVVRIGYMSLKKPVPEAISGPMYFGGPFQILHLLSPSTHQYYKSSTSLDALLSQSISAVSQGLIIVAACSAFGTRDEALGPLINSAGTETGSGFTPGPPTIDNSTLIEPGDVANLTLAVQNAAMFSSVTYTITVCAIIMTSFLNLIKWMADVWTTSKERLIVYETFKVVTRALTCQPCIGDGPLNIRKAKFFGSKGKKKTEDREALLEEAGQDPDGGDKDDGEGKGGKDSEKTASEKDTEKVIVITEKDKDGNGNGNGGKNEGEKESSKEEDEKESSKEEDEKESSKEA